MFIKKTRIFLMKLLFRCLIVFKIRTQAVSNYIRERLVYTPKLENVKKKILATQSTIKD